MKKILFISGDNCDDSEIQYPLFRLLEEGFSVFVAAKEKKIISAKHYVKTEVDLTIDEICSADYDALLLPGGLAPEKLRQIPKVLEVVNEFFSANKPVAAICHGQQILISAKVLKGKKATWYPGIRDDLINAGANYVNEQVVVDGNLVTSRRPEDLPFFMGAFVKLLK